MLYILRRTRNEGYNIMCEKIEIKEEQLTAEEYINFLKRTDLGSQYPKERFTDRISKLVNNVSISLVARNKNGLIVGVFIWTNRLCILALCDRFGSGQRL